MTTTNLGSFKKSGDGFVGNIHTLAFSAKIDLMPVEGGGDGSPAYRVSHKGREIGAAWVKTSRKSGAEFLSLKVVDLAFGGSPVYPALVESTAQPGTWNLLLNGQRD